MPIVLNPKAAFVLFLSLASAALFTLILYDDRYIVARGLLTNRREFKCREPSSRFVKSITARMT